MNVSFLATIAFALLALVMVFVANLAGYLLTWSLLHAIGMVLAVIAATACYGAQHAYTQGAGWLDHHQRAKRPFFEGPSDPDALAHYEASQRHGYIGQLAAIGSAVMAMILFLVGL